MEISAIVRYADDVWAEMEDPAAAVSPLSQYQ
jgi:hypothetical protein